MGVPWNSRAGKGGGARTSPSQDTVFSFACLSKSTSLGGEGQLVGHLFPNPREAELVGARKNSDLGDKGTERSWGIRAQVGSGKSKFKIWIVESKKPDRENLSSTLSSGACHHPLPLVRLRSTCLCSLEWGCGFVCLIKPICVHSGGRVVTAPGRDSILTTRPSHLPPRGAQI